MTKGNWAFKVEVSPDDLALWEMLELLGISSNLSLGRSRSGKLHIGFGPVAMLGWCSGMSSRVVPIIAWVNGMLGWCIGTPQGWFQPFLFGWMVCLDVAVALFKVGPCHEHEHLREALMGSVFSKWQSNARSFLSNGLFQRHPQSHPLEVFALIQNQ